MWYIAVATLGSLLAYVTYQAKYDTHGWYGKLYDNIDRKHRKLRRASQIIQAFSNGIEAQQAQSFTINDSGSSASITYNHVGKSYQVNVPFNSAMTNSMMPLRAVLYKVVHVGEPMKEIDITQEPGIPYSVCAHDLGGTKIVVTNIFTGGNKSYSCFECPGYVDELHYSE